MKIPKNLSLIFLIISFLFIIKNIYDLIIENYINLYEKISNISIFLLIIIVFYSIFSFSEKTINYSKVGIFIKKYFPYLILFLITDLIGLILYKRLDNEFSDNLLNFDLISSISIFILAIIYFIYILIRGNNGDVIRVNMLLL